MLHCSEVKVLTALLPYATSRNSSVKSETAVCLGMLAHRLKSKVASIKGSDRLVMSLATLLTDAS